MLAGRDHDAERVLVVHLHAVRAGVHPAGVRVAHDNDVAGAEEVAAVLGVPEGGRELRDVHLGVDLAVVKHGTVLDLPRGDGCELLEAVAPRLDELLAREVGGEVEAEADARERREDVRDEPVVLRVALDLVEEEGGVLHVPLVEVGEPADLEVGVGALDAGQLAHLLDARDPLTQVLHWHVALLVQLRLYPNDEQGWTGCTG